MINNEKPEVAASSSGVLSAEEFVDSLIDWPDDNTRQCAIGFTKKRDAAIVRELMDFLEDYCLRIENKRTGGVSSYDQAKHLLKKYSGGEQ